MDDEETDAEQRKRRRKDEEENTDSGRTTTQCGGGERVLAPEEEMGAACVDRSEHDDQEKADEGDIVMDELGRHVNDVDEEKKAEGGEGRSGKGRKASAFSDKEVVASRVDDTAAESAETGLPGDDHGKYDEGRQNDSQTANAAEMGATAEQQPRAKTSISENRAHSADPGITVDQDSTQAASPNEVTAEAEALARALGASASRRLLVSGLPSGVPSQELADFLSGAVLGVAGHAAAAESDAEKPCVACGIDARVTSAEATCSGILAFRSECAASIALRLDGLECHNSRLRLRRPDDYVSPPEGDRVATAKLDTISLAEILGNVPEGTDTQLPSEKPPSGVESAPGSGLQADAGADGGGSPDAASQAGRAEECRAPSGQQNGKQESVGSPETTKKPVPLPPEEKLSDNHYEALGVSLKATLSEIKKAYHTKSRLYHPDKNRHDPHATAKFQRVAEAYHLLSSPTKRAHYDATLVMQQACGSLGVQGDPRAAQFVQRHSMPGREVQAMQVEARHVPHLIGKNGYQLQQLKLQSGADILLLQNQLSVYAQVLMAGPPASIVQARNLITSCIEEITGARAPRDGVVLVVPQAMVSRMPQAASQFQAIYLQTAAMPRFASTDRIVVQGGVRVPQAVVQIQWLFDWRLQVLMPTGQVLDPWSYAHLCETAGAAAAPMARSAEAYQYLLPPSDPDGPTVRRVLCLALGMMEDSVMKDTLVDLTTRTIETYRNANRLITGAMAKAATSVAVHAEHASLSPQAGAPLLIALHSVMAVAGTTMAPRFTGSPLMKTLTALGTALNDPREGLTLRARGFTAFRDAVPEDGAWHKWEDVLPPKRSDSPLTTFWLDLRNWLVERRHSLGVSPPPMEWLCPPVLTLVIRWIQAPGVLADPLKGIQRSVTVSSMPGGAAAAAMAAAAMTPSAGIAASVPQSSPTGGFRAPRPPGFVPPAAAQATANRAPQEGAAGGVASGSGGSSAHGSDEAKGDEQEPMTLVEIVEEVLLTLAGTDPAAYVPIGMLTQEAQKRAPAGAERLSKKWYDSHRKSFELRRNPQSGGDDWRVRLAAEAKKRVQARNYERQAAAQRLRELRIAEEVLPKLLADNLPKTLRSPELAGLLCKVSEGQHVVRDDLACALLRRLCRRGEATPKELLHEASPFAPALLMRAIVALEKQRRERWDKEALDILLQAAALDMHVVDHRPRAALPTAAAALWAGARRPFDERLNASRCLLVPSAALRLQVELSEPAALSPEGSAFRPFAQMCAWLAHLVVTAFASLPDEVKTEVLQAFRKLAAACEELGKAPESAPCDPEGLCRLAMAVALVVRDERERGVSTGNPANVSYGTDALEGLARVCVQRALDEEFNWRPQQIAVLASAYAAAEVPHDGLFRKIGVIAERHTMLGNEWSTDQLLKLLHSAWQLGQLGKFQALLQNLQSDQGLHKYVKEANPRDVPLLFAVLVLVKDKPLLDELSRTQRDKLSGLTYQSLLALIKGLPSEAEHPSISAFKAAAITRLGDVSASPSFLSTLPLADASWQDIRTGLTTALGSFASLGVETPRLEACCAARLLVALEKTQADIRETLPAVLALSENALMAMPAVVAALADRFARARLPRPGSGDGAKDARLLCDRLVRVAVKFAAKKDKSRISTDSEFDSWVERFERCALAEEGRSNERRLDSLEQQVIKRMPSGLRDTLGSSWAATLLVRSRRLAWAGGKTVLLEAPRPRAAVRRLADAAGMLLSSSSREEAESLQPEAPAVQPGAARPSRGPTSSGGASPSASAATTTRETPVGPGTAAARVGTATASKEAAGKPSVGKLLPGSLVVSGGWDAGMADTIAGTYMPSSTNHGRGVYRRVDPPQETKVLLYYWDERDGEENRGWWFGPEVGGEEVWAHNPGMLGNALPPVKGWVVLHSGTIDPGINVAKVEAPRSNAPAVPSQQGRGGAAGARASSTAPPPPPPPRPRPQGSVAGSASRPTPSVAGGAGAAASAASQRARPGGAAPTAVASSTALGSKRPRYDVARASELRSWLQGLDDGAGAMVQYFDVLANEFDADLAQIAAAKVDGGDQGGILGVVDPSFWDTVRVTKAGHKMLFARGIAKL
eukprot:TRINITY_DN14595_c0_g1_i2.p1 TRINITY_DN14595_c0_g1~~TRINITY_DN14595_c0_g1_i2.p1  ORF type:complete len:2124 (+),score=411.43 TRINITY_DN14595_c0_g1_i2:108-6374(+)